MAIWYSEKWILVKPEMLSEGFIPESVRGREAQLKEINACLLPAKRSQKPVNTWLYGPSGSGKTLLARYLLNQFMKEGVLGTYINCWETPTFHSLMDRIVRTLRILQAERIDTRVKVDQFQGFLKSRPFILILDEIDKVANRERNSMLYNLSSIGNVGTICICNRLNILFSLEPRVRSRLSAKVVEFKAYNEETLEAILKERAEAALTENTWDPSLLAKIVSMAKGDARIALQMLRDAALLAEADRVKRIEEKHLQKGWDKMDSTKHEYLLNNLTLHHKILYEIIKHMGELYSGQLWRDYLDQCRIKGKRPVALRTYFAYVNKLEELGMIKSEKGKTRGNQRHFSIVS